jgi:hypothetical protein
MHTQFIANLLEDSIDPRFIEETLSHSYSNFHVPGVEYACLLRTKQLTVKLYYFPTGVGLNNQGLLVHPHDHGYEFETTVLKGQLRNHNYRIERGDSWAMNQYSSKLKNESGMSMQFLQMVELVEYESRLMNKGQSYNLDTDTIHSISVNPNRDNAILLTQHASKVERESTLIFIPKAEEVPTDVGLYQPMSKERLLEVISLVL